MDTFNYIRLGQRETKTFRKDQGFRNGLRTAALRTAASPCLYFFCKTSFAVAGFVLTNTQLMTLSEAVISAEEVLNRLDSILAAGRWL